MRPRVPARDGGDFLTAAGRGPGGPVPSLVEGRVTTTHLVSNTTGNDALGGCMVRAVQTLRFDATVTADVAEFPWVIGT